MSDPSHPEGNELAPKDVLRLYGMRPHSAKKLIAKIEADALREAADDLAVKLQTFLGGREKLFIEVDRLRERADRIEGAIND